jgi:hypothetical protein
MVRNGNGKRHHPTRGDKTFERNKALAKPLKPSKKFGIAKGGAQHLRENLIDEGCASTARNC